MKDVRITNAQADRAATLLQEAAEARNKTWLGRSTVRTFTSGTHFELTDSPLDVLQAVQNKTQSANNNRTLLLPGEPRNYSATLEVRW